MLTAADVLASAFALPAPDSPPLEFPAPLTCALTGVPITSGYAMRPLLQKSTAIILDTIRGNIDGHISDAAARCWLSVGPGKPLMKGGLAFEDGTAYQPMIALKSGQESGRGCWRDVVREVWPSRQGQRLVMILTTDTKKRLWTNARLGSLGEATPIYVCDGNTLQSLSVSWPRMLACLDLVESLYSRGFGKDAIRDNLLSSWATAQSWGLAETIRWDRAIAPWRDSPEMLVALLIAQRETILEPPANAESAPRHPVAPSTPLQGDERPPLPGEQMRLF